MNELLQDGDTIVWYYEPWEEPEGYCPSLAQEYWNSIREWEEEEKERERKEEEYEEWLYIYNIRHYNPNYD